MAHLSVYHLAFWGNTLMLHQLDNCSCESVGDYPCRVITANDESVTVLLPEEKEEEKKEENKDWK